MRVEFRAQMRAKKRQLHDNGDDDQSQCIHLDKNRRKWSNWLFKLVPLASEENISKYKQKISQWRTNCSIIEIMQAWSR